MPLMPFAAFLLGFFLYSMGAGGGDGALAFVAAFTKPAGRSGANPAPRMLIPPNDNPDDLEEDAACRTIVVVVVGRATAAPPIFVAATGFLPASIFVRFAADARIADASRFAPAIFSRSALSAFSFSAAASFAAASWDSFRTRLSQMDFTTPA